MNCDYVWEPWLEHDWLAVDASGNVGYFISASAQALPSGVRIPWPYLHNLYKMWHSYMCDSPLPHFPSRGGFPDFEGQVDALAKSGLFVWDAKTDGKGGEFCLIAHPKKPILVDALHPFFRKIANGFFVADESFAEVNVSRGNFICKSEFNFDGHRCCLKGTGNDRSIDVVRNWNVSTVNSFSAEISFADSCALADAPGEIGATFSCWDSVRPRYVGLVSAIAAEIGATTCSACDFWGARGNYEVSKLNVALDGMSLPFYELTLTRRDGRNIRMSVDIEDVVGAGAYLPTGFLRRGTVDAHIEDWRVRIRIDDDKRRGPRIIEKLFAFRGNKREAVVSCQI